MPSNTKEKAREYYLKNRKSTKEVNINNETCCECCIKNFKFHSAYVRHQKSEMHKLAQELYDFKNAPKM